MRWSRASIDRGDGMAAGMVTGDGLTRQERYLVHQVHPAKLATDIGAAAVSTVLFWRHRLVLGLLVFLVPAPVASVLVLRGDLSALLHLLSPARAARLES
jgi:hypothetical protein